MLWDLVRLLLGWCLLDIWFLVLLFKLLDVIFGYFFRIGRYNFNELLWDFDGRRLRLGSVVIMVLKGKIRIVLLLEDGAFEVLEIGCSVGVLLFISVDGCFWFDGGWGLIGFDCWFDGFIVNEEINKYF